MMSLKRWKIKFKIRIKLSHNIYTEVKKYYVNIAKLYKKQIKLTLPKLSDHVERVLLCHNLYLHEK